MNSWSDIQKEYVRYVDVLLTRNEGERKFSMNQNLTVLLVFRKTLIIMIEAKR